MKCTALRSEDVLPFVYIKKSVRIAVNSYFICSFGARLQKKVINVNWPNWLKVFDCCCTQFKHALLGKRWKICKNWGSHEQHNNY